MSETAKLRAWGKWVGRAGMSQRVIDEIAAFDGTNFKQAMRLAGKLSQIAVAARCDEYWNEQVEHGKSDFLRSGLDAQPPAIALGAQENDDG